MRTEAQTSMHLLLAGMVSGFSVIMTATAFVMSWELWMVPLIVLGCLVVWWLHIGRIGSELLYENICAGLLMSEFFFFGVHQASFFGISTIACVLCLVFSLMDRKWLLYLTAGLYVLELLYHFVFFNITIDDMARRDVVYMGVGVAAVAGAVMIARYRINRREKEKKKYSSMVAELEASGRQNADFLSTVSHELRTPINMVIGLSEVALGKENATEIYEDLQSIKLAGKRLSNQINKILDYAEIVEGTLTAAEEGYRITSVINDVITTTTLQNSRSQLEMVFDVDPKIPTVLVGDAGKISHVLKILVENSIKFTEEGGINVCVGFRQESYGVNLVIDIYDTGIGMTSTQLTKMFADFYQADSGSRRLTGGLGLGIPIARGLLHAMGGFIHFDSKEQEGLQAHIIIPQGVEDETPSMVVTNAARLCIACFFSPEKYNCDEVRRYYDKLILHLVEGLGVEGYQAHTFEGLVKLQREHNLTHVFIAQSEYETNKAYYEAMAMTIQVIVFADRKFTLDRDSGLLLICKPFFALSVVNLLNGQPEGKGYEKAQGTERKAFYCEGVRALAVDDEEMNLVVAKGVLGSYGMEVDTCLNGREAVERCRQTFYDIVFLDHMMPGFDGVETLQRIRKINNGMYQDLPVVALTANTISGAREMFRNEGFTEFIPKPIERIVLERVLRKVLSEQCMKYAGDFVVQDSKPQEKAASSFLFEVEGDGQGNEAYDVQPENTLTDEALQKYAVLIQAGINVEVGLDYCCGEDEFYMEMLQMFSSRAGERMDELKTLYEAANWADYSVKAHALKSTALTIGAEELSSFAKKLEQAGKDEDVEYIQNHHAALLDMYVEVCKAISKL